ncbi:hypothetical protein Bca52824_029472 [Brassica carinata]|uniref:Glycylpeptide N-tetradecanoyltransferase n=1 Tax=Brassica carinata TaxID=52824 RepID=A0A8X7VEL4_BRACI|nr:hypothetical protein Bca52824_029472 [Brassica carinata]
MKKERGKKKVVDEVKEEEDPPRSAEEAKQAQLIKDITSRCQMYNDDADSTHNFWVTQPMERLSDIQDLSLEDGPIVVTRSEVKQDPYALPSNYEWIDCDLNCDDMSSQVAVMLTQNFTARGYMLRETYSKDFLRWALQPPNYYASWHFGVCVKRSKKLVAFIGGVPSRIRVRGNKEVVNMAAVKILCVHEKLRSQKLGALMMREMNRRVQSQNIWQGIFASGVIVPTPISTYTYWTRILNVKKLLAFGVWMSQSPDGKDMSVETAEKLYKVPGKMVTPGFRKMLPSDVSAVTQLIGQYLSQFEVAEYFTSEQVQHFLLPRQGVIDSYVVVNAVTSSVSDFCSFYTFYYSCESQKEPVKFAYSFYNIATTMPLVQLMMDALAMAKKEKFDTFAAADIMENGIFLEKLKFEATPNRKHLYLYNQRLKTGVKASNVGVVLI